MYRPHTSYQILTNITNFVLLRKLSIYCHLHKSHKSPTVLQCEFHPMYQTGQFHWTSKVYQAYDAVSPSGLVYVMTTLLPNIPVLHEVI